MHRDLFLVLYNSLGRVLQNLQSQPDVENAPEARAMVENALGFHREMEHEFKKFLDENRALAEELAKPRMSPIDTESLPRIIEKYKGLQRVGATPRVIYEIAKNDGVNDIDHLKVLCNVFGLSWHEAEDLILQFENS